MCQITFGLIPCLKGYVVSLKRFGYVKIVRAMALLCAQLYMLLNELCQRGEQLTVDLVLAFVNVWVLPWVVPSKEECFEGQPASCISGVKTQHFAKTFSKKRSQYLLRTNTAVQKFKSRK